MELLENHLSNYCDPRMVGVLSLSIKEAYRFLEDLIQQEKILQHPDMRKTWGHIRHGLVDVGLKQVLKSSGVPHEIADKTSSRYRNGHTYLMIETKGAIITPAKVNTISSVPKKALYRSKGSLLNKNYNLFDNPENVNDDVNDNKVPFLLLTYGGKNYKLDFVSLGLPDVGSESWIDCIDITNAPVILLNEQQISNDLQLTFTSKAEELIRRGVEYGEEGAL